MTDRLSGSSFSVLGAVVVLAAATASFHPADTVPSTDVAAPVEWNPARSSDTDSHAGLSGTDPLARASSPADPLSRVTASLEACRREGCAGVVYVWSDRMPLSRAGIAPVAEAAKEVGIDVTLLESEALAAYASAGAVGSAVHVRTADRLLRSGALAHAPALVVYAGGRVLGPAIFGYKTSEAYASALRRRLPDGRRRNLSDGVGESVDARVSGGLDDGVGRPEHDGIDSLDPSPSGDRASPIDGPFQTVAELEAEGRPGAYFRWVPGRQAIAYESGGDVYLLDLSDGGSRGAPGYVDFVPSPDGRFFVTPAPRRIGMEFYHAARVFDAVDDGEPGRVDPVFTDRAMQDQYPSVGILEQEGDGATGMQADRSRAQEPSRTVYRVLTSWFEGIRYRDYQVAGDDGEIRPLGSSRVEPCRGRQLSIPIMSQDGLEVAARDESTGTTKVFRLLEGGRCREVTDLGVQTGKVAWHWSGRLLAFARPPLRARIGPGFRPRRAPGDFRSRPGGGTPEPDLEAADGIFVYDRDEERMWRVPGSEDASSLAFPEFVGDDRLVYLVPGTSGGPSVFRVVEGRWQ